MGARRRFASSSYDGGHAGRATKELLEGLEGDHALAVFDHHTHADDIARAVAQSQSGRAFFVMDIWQLEERVCEWRRAFPTVSPLFSLSVNADPVLLQLLSQFEHLYFQVTSLSELEYALSIVPPHRIQFSCPLLTRRTLRLLSQVPLHSLVVDNESSLCAASSLCPSIPLVLRLSIDDSSIESSIGFPIEDALQYLHLASSLSEHPIGVCALLIGDESCAWRPRFAAISDLLSSAIKEGIEVSFLDVGGAFPSDRHDLLKQVCVLMEEWLSCLPIRLFASPSRFLVSSVFSLCTSIIGKADVRLSERKCHVYQTNEGLYGVFGGTQLGERPSCLPLFGQGQLDLHESVIVGCDLDSMNIPQPRALLPHLAIGDWLLWRDMGAYSLCGNLDDLPPVYYFTVRGHWNTLMDRKNRGYESQ